MLVFHGARGGAGCTVVAATVAAASARRRPTLLVDLKGDLPDLAGRGPDGPDLDSWLAADEVVPGSLHRLAWQIAPGLRALAVSPGSAADPAPMADADRSELLALLLLESPERVVVDLGVPTVATAPLLQHAATSVLVTRACYLALVAARRNPPPDQVVVVREPGRALRRGDCGEAVGAPVALELDWDPAVARAVDAGLLLSRPPRSLRPLEVFT